MNHTTIKKIGLMTFALGAVLAVSALANGPRDLLTAAQNHGNAAPSHNQHILQLPTDTLFYNGDFDGVNGLSNELDTSLGSGQYGHTYDDFYVTDSGGWNVTGIFSDNLTNTGITGATWEIRQDISEGNGGTLVASGTTDTPVVTDTGRSGFGYIEHQVLVDGLNICLPTGHYFLDVVVVGDLTDRAFVSTTSKANSIGTGDPGNSWFDSNFFGFNFTSVVNVLGAPTDFSFGVVGTVGCGVSGIVLAADVHRSHGKRIVSLAWSPASGGTIDVLKNGTDVLTTDDDGGVQDFIGTQTGTFFYQVCKDTNCSNTVRVKVH